MILAVHMRDFSIATCIVILGKGQHNDRDQLISSHVGIGDKKSSSVSHSMWALESSVSQCDPLPFNVGSLQVEVWSYGDTCHRAANIESSDI